MSIFSTELYDDLGEWANILKLNPDFFYVRSEHKIILASKDFKQVKNWLKIYRGEMTFSEYHSIPNYRLKNNLPIKEDENKTVATKRIKLRKSTLNASINLEDYITPEIIGLLDIESNNRPSLTNGIAFEELVADAFNLLGFEVDQLEQVSGKEANTIIKLREEDTAFIVDAKAYSNGYDLVMNDRAFKENAQLFCHEMSKKGYKKFGYVMVNNSFKSNFDGLINTIAWSTDINKIILLESEVLLYLLAYKTKDKLSLPNMIDKLVEIANPVKAQNIIEVFDNI